jgi:tetratricopeptide (TPR) repeat protein
LRAIRLRPGHGLAHYAAGVNSLLLCQEEQALEHLEEFLRVEPESHLHYITHAWRGISLARKEDDEAARAAFDEAFSLYPGQFIALLVLTCIEKSQGNVETAQHHLRTARSLEPDVTLDLLKARVGRFFAGSPRREAMLEALDRLWPQVSNQP